MNQLDLDYQNLLKDILENGVEKETRNGKVLSVFGRSIRYEFKDGKFPLLTTKKMAFKTMVVELLWFLRGDTNIKFLHDNNCHIWDGDYEKSGRTDGNLGPIYGKQWREWNRCCEMLCSKHQPIDQIANLINELKTNPDSRRLMVNAYNVGELDQMVLPPCHYGFQMYTRELSAKERTALGSKGSTRLYDMIKESNYETIDADIEMHKVCDEANVPKRAISLMWNQRSVDTALGLPMNIASYALLLLMIADEVNMVPDQLIGNLGDVHLYSDHLEGAKEQITRTPYELPKVNINTEWRDKPFFEAVKSDNFCKCLLEEDIQLYNYQSHPKIYFPLSN